MRGRPRKHAAMKLLDGTLRPHRDDTGADMRPATGDCRPTRKLSEHGQRFFDVVLRAYPPGTLGESDSESLTKLSETVEATHDLQEHRDELDFGQYVKLKGEIDKQYWQGAVRFGLSPADRGKVKLTGPAEGEQKEQKFFGVTG